MPIVINQTEAGRKQSAMKQPPDRAEALAESGLLSDLKVRITLIAAVVLLVLGLIGWSQGWFGEAAVVPADASAVRPSGSASTPLGGSEEGNPMGHKRNKGIGE